MGSSYTFGEGSSDLFFLRTDVDGFTGCNEQVASPGVSTISINEIPSNLVRYYGLSSVAYSGSPTINNISLTSSTECAGLATITNYTDVSCYGSCDGVGICIAGGGTPPYSIIWDDPLMQINDTATGLCAGTYQVMISDNALDTIYQTVVISSPPELTIITSTDTMICHGQSTNLTVSGASTYTWDNSAGTGSTVSVSPSTTTTYTVTGTDTNTCIDTAQVTVTVNPLPDVTVSQSGIALTAQNVNVGITYQWVDCNNSFAALSGETNQTFTATNNGSYAVIINENGCADTSTCYNVTSVGIIENDFGNKLIIYPNPTNGNFSIDLGENLKTVMITLTDLLGKVIWCKSYNNSQLLNLKLEESAGVYLLIVESGVKLATIRLVQE